MGAVDWRNHVFDYDSKRVNIKRVGGSTRVQANEILSRWCSTDGKVKEGNKIRVSGSLATRDQL